MLPLRRARTRRGYVVDRSGSKVYDTASGKSQRRRIPAPDATAVSPQTSPAR